MNPLIKSQIDTLELSLKAIEHKCVQLRERNEKADVQLEESKQTVWALRKEITTSSHLHQELDKVTERKETLAEAQSTLKIRLQALLRNVRSLSAYMDPHV
jgi:chromosome segregation ATPase